MNRLDMGVRTTEIGIFTQWVQADSIEQLAYKIAGYELDCVVLDVFPGMALDKEAPSAEDCRRIRRAFEQAGVGIAAIGAYSNLLHPNASTRAAIQRQFSGLMRLGAEVGASMICAETGSCHPQDDWAWDPANGTEQAYQQLLGTLQPFTKQAEELGVIIALEPYVMNIVGSASRAARLIRELDSPHVQLVMDPAGLLTRLTLADQSDSMNEIFSKIGGYLGIVHVEDCLANEQDHFDFLPAGKGAINYPLYMDLIVGTGYQGPLILEHLEEAGIPPVREFVLREWKAALVRKEEGNR